LDILLARARPLRALRCVLPMACAPACPCEAAAIQAATGVFGRSRDRCASRRRVRGTRGTAGPSRHAHRTLGRCGWTDLVHRPVVREPADAERPFDLTVVVQNRHAGLGPVALLRADTLDALGLAGVRARWSVAAATAAARARSRAREGVSQPM